MLYEIFFFCQPLFIVCNFSACSFNIQISDESTLHSCIQCAVIRSHPNNEGVTKHHGFHAGGQFPFTYKPQIQNRRGMAEDASSSKPVRGRKVKNKMMSILGQMITDTSGERLVPAYSFKEKRE